MEIKSKTDGSIRWVVLDSSTPNFVIFIVLGYKGNLLISFPTNRTPKVSREVVIQPSLSHPLAIVAF
jgi:hypothetical protein